MIHILNAHLQGHSNYIHSFSTWYTVRSIPNKLKKKFEKENIRFRKIICIMIIEVTFNNMIMFSYGFFMFSFFFQFIYYLFFYFSLFCLFFFLKAFLKEKRIKIFHCHNYKYISVLLMCFQLAIRWIICIYKWIIDSF